MENMPTVVHEPRIQPVRQRQEHLRSEDGATVSEAVYWESYYPCAGNSDVRYEWNNGYLEEKPVSDYANDLMVQWFIDIVRHFLHVHPIGKLITVEMGFRFVLPRKTLIRRPDFSVVLHTNPVSLHLKDHSYAGIFNLCIELISDLTLKDIHRDTIQKKREYGAAGVQEYFILDASGENMAFYRRNRRGIYEPIPPVHDETIRSDVLPGFQFRISDLHLRPALEHMAGDPVYREFVYLSYQAEKQRAEQERQRAEQEKKRAEQAETQLLLERQRAEHLAEQLRSLGISPEA